MKYEMIKPLVFYNGQKLIDLPRTGKHTDEVDESKNGFGNMIFFLTPSQKDTIELLSTDYLNYTQPLYRKYYIEGVYREKIGRKKVILNAKNEVRTYYMSNRLSNVQFVPYGTRKTVLLTKKNMLVDLGYWHSLYFKYSLKMNRKTICERYLAFLASKLNDSLFNEYDKRYLIIDLDSWYKNKKFSFDKEALTDPLSIILLSIYRYPEFMGYLGNVELLVIDAKNSQFLKIPRDKLNKRNYSVLKNRLSKFYILGNIEEVSEESSEENFSDEQKVLIEKTKQDIVSSLKKNLTGEPVKDWVTNSDEIDFEDSFDETEEKDYTADSESFDEDSEPTDEDIEIDMIVSNRLSEIDAPLDENEQDELVAELEKEIQSKVYVSSIMPKKTPKEEKRIQELLKKQKAVIGPRSSTAILKSKTIEISDFSSYVSTSNPDIVKSSYVNFNHDYNEKKLPQNIDDCVAKISEASSGVYIVDKKEEDTSDALNLKKTITYSLQDERGKRMTIKIDIPIVIEDNYLFLNGEKRIVTHQRILKPITHVKPDTVWITSYYNKIRLLRKGMNDKYSSSVYKYITANDERFKIKYGNTLPKNVKYITPLEFDIFAKSIHSFRIGDAVFITDLDECKEKCVKLNIDLISKPRDSLLVGYNAEAKTPIFLRLGENYAELLTTYMTANQLKALAKTEAKGRMMFVQAKMLEKDIPIVLFMFFCDGFTEVMKKANINYKFVTAEEASSYDSKKYGTVVLNDGVIIWDRYPLKNSLLMNGLQNVGMDIYSFKELDSKDTYIALLSHYYQYAAMAFNLDQFKDFMIDPVTAEILSDFGYPTDLTELLLVGIEMLTTNKSSSVNNLSNMRIRSTEIIAQHVYHEITTAYNRYRKTLHRKNPTAISIKQDQIIQDILKSRLLETASVLNPVLELDKNRSVTYKSESGINLEESFTLDKRAYDESMLGVMGISTPNDKNVGVVRHLTLEPKITSTYGYIEPGSKDTVQELNSANMLTPSEMLTPLGVRHDDPDRTTMVFKQTAQMLPVADAEPVMIGNKVESIIPYHLSEDFTVVAKQDGIIEDIKNGIVVIKYKDGTFKSIDTNPSLKKNSSNAFYIESQLKCDKQIGDSVKKGEVVAYDPQHFVKNANDLSASMKLGVLVKIAVTPNWDIYEDSAPITESLSERLATNMIMDKVVSLNQNSYVQSIVKIGDEIKTGDPLIVFDQSLNDPDQDLFIEEIRKSMGEEIVNSTITTVTSKYSGVIEDIRIMSTVDLEELSPSLQKIVGDYYARIKKKDAVFTKYKNPGDSKFYKSGHLITESATKVTPNAQGKVGKETVGNGVIIKFFIKIKDYAGKGDKICAEFALKSVTSHVIEKGMEPYSEFRPNEEISTLISPLSVSARKVPSLYLAMFGNKLLIEFKRRAKEKYFT